MPKPEKSTHVLVPASQFQELDDLHRRTRILKNTLMHEAVQDLLALYASGSRATPLPKQPEQLGMTSLVFRLPAEVTAELNALPARTRIRQSEHLREALEDLLVKYRADASASTDEAA